MQSSVVFFKFLRGLQLESLYRIVFCKRKPFFFSGFMIIYTGEIVTCAIYMTLNLPQNQMWNFSCKFHVNSSSYEFHVQIKEFMLKCKFASSLHENFKVNFTYNAHITRNYSCEWTKRASSMIISVGISRFNVDIIPSNIGRNKSLLATKAYIKHARKS